MDVIPLALPGTLWNWPESSIHQSTMSSLQWKPTFLLTPTVTYPFSVITVVLNSIVPIFLTPLLRFGIAPHWVLLLIRQDRLNGKARLYPWVTYHHTTLLLGTSVSGAILRRHLMVWKGNFLLPDLWLLFEIVGRWCGCCFGCGYVERAAGKI